MLLDFARPQAGQPLYSTLYSNIRDAVENGVIKKGEKLPSIREAASQLDVSRTTVENAYLRLCIEGIAESLPQKGYFICGGVKERPPRVVENREVNDGVRYDFSTQKIDTAAADTDIWKKIIRRVLNLPQQLTSYGDAQGEEGLREALASYSYKTRGVRTTADNIVIGAGVGPLLNILCGLLGREVKVGIENGGFSLAENIFSDYGIKTSLLPSDKNGATVKGLKDSGAKVLFLMPSSLSKISVTNLAKRRNEYTDWVYGADDRLIIEDDYNGELRYTARTVPAFQAKAWDRTVYIGSFSKLLLPSVRIAYMVLPDGPAEEFAKKKRYYNQTCGKIEQSALCEYINSGGLEKHLRRLRRLYYAKSQLLCKEISEKVPCVGDILLYESSLTAELITDLPIESSELCEVAKGKGIRIMPSAKRGAARLCFAGIASEDIPQAVNLLAEGLKEKINN